MNLDELRAAQSKERQTDSLQHLRESFYEEAAEYIAELEDERDRAAEAVEDPFASHEVRQLTDEIETAREVVEAIYERRLGKLVKTASLAAADIPTDDDGLTMEERALFEDLVERIEENKSRVLDVLDDGGGDQSAAETGEPEATAPDRPPGTESERAPGTESERAPETESGRAPGTDPDRDTIASEEAASVAGPPEGDRNAAAPDDSLAGVSETDGPVEDAAAAMGGSDAQDTARTNGSGAVGATDAGGDEAVRTNGTGPETNGTSPREGDPGDDPGADTAATTDASNGADDAPADARDSVDRTMVRVTENVEQFYGLDDREYDLDEEDVVTLPEANAEPLLQRGVAERLE